MVKEILCGLGQMTIEIASHYSRPVDKNKKAEVAVIYLEKVGNKTVYEYFKLAQTVSNFKNQNFKQPK